MWFVPTESASSAVCPRLLPSEILYLLSVSILFTFSSSQVPRDFFVSYLPPSFLLSLPLRFREISSFLISLHPFLFSLPLKFREIFSFLISLHPFYSLFFSGSERFPRFLSPSILFTLPSSQVPRDFLRRRVNQLLLFLTALERSH
jgi:hypothetical protein